MRLALFADIHGHAIALDAVLADVEAQGGADAYWVIGDLVAFGPDPVTVLQRLSRLPQLHVVRGNTDRYVTTADRPPGASLETVQADPSLLPGFAEVSQSLAWTQGAVTASGWLDWLSELPLERRGTLPDGTRLLAVHASPGRDDGGGVHPALEEAALETLLAGCDADLVCVGHTHWPLERRSGSVRAINVGSVGNPLRLDLRASYVLLEADTTGCQVHFRRVAYDYGAAMEAVRRVRHPGSRFILNFLQGNAKPGWEPA
jgi:predicted phosphodiesterase